MFLREPSTLNNQSLMALKSLEELTNARLALNISVSPCLGLLHKEKLKLRRKLPLSTFHRHLRPMLSLKLLRQKLTWWSALLKESLLSI